MCVFIVGKRKRLFLKILCFNRLLGLNFIVNCLYLFLVEEEVWREVALSQLLMLVDIPVLDTILSYDATEEKSGKQQSSAAFSNLAFKRWESITSLFSDKYA